jgi:3-methyladenine DNA glycosylase AlkD
VNRRLNKITFDEFIVVTFDIKMKLAQNKYTKEVEDTLNRLSLKNDKEKTEKLKKYIGTNLNVLRLATKAQVDAHKKGFSFYSEEKVNTFLLYHDIYMQSKIFEVKNLAFIFLDKNHKYVPLKIQLKTLPLWVKYIDNWAHSDGLSKFLTRLIENENTKKDMLDIIKKWNASKNLWERRQSLVSLYYYSRTKKQHIDFELTQQLVFPLLSDNEYYVQKAVGWTLRESYNVYPKQTYSFIATNIKKITSTAFTTCIEKMTEQEKQTLKLNRKK